MWKEEEDSTSEQADRRRTHFVPTDREDSFSRETGREWLCFYTDRQKEGTISVWKEEEDSNSEQAGRRTHFVPTDREDSFSRETSREWLCFYTDRQKEGTISV